MVSEERQAVDAHVAALNRGDLQDVLDTFTVDAVFSSDAGIARGHAELAGLFDNVGATDRPTTILRRALQDGPVLDCVLTRRFVVSDEQGRVAAAHDVEVRAVFTVSAGAISLIQVDPIV